jgi:hypothetical protein
VITFGFRGVKKAEFENFRDEVPVHIDEPAGADDGVQGIL